MEPKQTMPLQAPIFLPAVLVIALVALFTMSGNVRAGLGGSRADPVITFTDGTRLTMITDLDIGVDQVTRIEYTVTTPPGKVVDHITYDRGGLGVKEQVTVVAGAAGDGYTIDQYARTTVAAQVTAINMLGFTTRSATGPSTTHLVMTMTP
jgi:hypothetical protein